jgi:ATP-dependent Lon protease
LHDYDLHVHVPAGAVPKDGPSAGVAMITAMVSLLTGRPVQGDVGMTGEITLQGRVLPVGGVKMKVLAAHRTGLKTVILPHRNEQDLDDLPEDVKEAMTFVTVENIDQVLEAALRPATAAAHRSPTNGNNRLQPVLKWGISQDQSVRVHPPRFP